jgi:hypothetical protein
VKRDAHARAFPPKSDFVAIANRGAPDAASVQIRTIQTSDVVKDEFFTLDSEFAVTVGNGSLHLRVECAVIIDASTDGNALTVKMVLLAPALPGHVTEGEKSKLDPGSMGRRGRSA